MAVASGAGDAAGAGDWVAVGSTDVGLLRERNEDAFSVDEEVGCYLVADGLGGLPCGDVASRLARGAARGYLRRRRAALVAGTAGDVLGRAVGAAHRRILRAAIADSSLEGMATTLTLLWLGDGGRGHVAHVGDSRVYRLSRGGLSQLTEDHTVAMDMVRSGEATIEEAEQSFAWDLLTRTVGGGGAAAIDAFAVEGAGAEAFLLCTDGLTGMVGDADVARLLRAHAPNAEAACRALIDAALSAGGHDNVTVVVVYPRRRGN